MSDLVSGLLAKLDEIEKQAQDCIDEVGEHRVGDRYDDGSGTADRDAFPSYPWGSEARELAFMAGAGHPDAILRLCRAHRQIIDMYAEAKKQPIAQSVPHSKGRGLDHASAMGRLTALGLVVEALAEGYGLKKGQPS